jgi:hypothetical protein
LALPDINSRSRSSGLQYPSRTKQESFLPELEIHKSEHGFTQPVLRVDLIPIRGNFDFSSRSAFQRPFAAGQQAAANRRKSANCAALPET